MRSFIGIDLPDEIKKELFDLKERLSPLSDQGRWTSRYNYHLNLKFLGDVSEKQQKSIEKRVEEVCAEMEPFTLHINTIGAFGLDPALSVKDKSGMKTLWIGVSGDTDKLKALQYRIEMALTREGFPANLRDYAPHIALGENMVFNCDFRHIRKEMSTINRTLKVDRVCLFKSEHEGLRRIYTPITGYDLKK